MSSARLALALAAAFAISPFTGAFAETAEQDTGSVAQDAGQAGEVVAQAPEKKGLFNFLAPKDDAARQERAERRAAAKAEREARRAEKKRERGLESGQSASTGDAARSEVKEAVAHADANKPKGRLWRVPFARMVSGVDIRGNAKTWWEQAKGRYERGQEPAVGAVMAFAASRSMPKGHVAVVSKVLSEREILIDQANWERNRITLDTLVVDVSDKGDWSRVKVANEGGSLGRVNPVNGFIYN